MTGGVRRARPQDAAAIAAITAPFARETTITFRPEPLPASHYAQALREEIHVVWEDPDGSVTGYAGLSRFRAGAGYDRVREVSIGLAPQARGGGRGRALMQALEAAARAHGHLSLVAGISGENAAGLAFHAACGFAEVGRMPGVGVKFGRRLDLVLMQKDLSPPAAGG